MFITTGPGAAEVEVGVEVEGGRPEEKQVQVKVTVEIPSDQQLSEKKTFSFLPHI